MFQMSRFQSSIKKKTKKKLIIQLKNYYYYLVLKLYTKQQLTP